MSRYGLKIAELFGRKLPGFRTLDEARADLFALRDARLGKLATAASKSGIFVPDRTSESLKGLEQWYFRLVESDSFRELGLSREEFECCMASYFCHVVVGNCPDAEWHVAEFAFEKGKYEIGVRRGLLHFMRSSFRDHYKRPSNVRRTAIFREYQKYFGAA